MATKNEDKEKKNESTEAENKVQLIGADPAAGVTLEEAQHSLAVKMGFESVDDMAEAMRTLTAGHQEWKEQQDVIKRLTSVAESGTLTQYDAEEKIPVTNTTSRPIHISVGRVANSKEVIPNISVPPLGVAYVPESLFKTHRGLIELVDTKILRVLGRHEVDKQEREHAGVLTGGAEND